MTINAPFTIDQIASITRYQNSPYTHPYTCTCGQKLVAILDDDLGLRCPRGGCGYTQSKVHAFSANFEWLGMEKVITKLRKEAGIKDEE